MKPFSARFLCQERRGVVIRKVQEIEPSRHLELHLTEKLSVVPSPLKDLSMIYSKEARVFLVDNVGVLIKGPLDYVGRPDVHIGFWDKVLVGREWMCYKMAEVVASEAGADGVFTAIPLGSRATLAFARRVGFKVVHEAKNTAILTMDFVHDVHRSHNGF